MPSTQTANDVDTRLQYPHRAPSHPSKLPAEAEPIEPEDELVDDEAELVIEPEKIYALSEENNVSSLEDGPPESSPVLDAVRIAMNSSRSYLSKGLKAQPDCQIEDV